MTAPLHIVDKLSRISLLVLALLLPAALYAVFKLPIGSAGVHEWLPQGRVERDRYEKFLSQFGSDQVLVVSWDDADANDPRVENLVERIRQNSGADSLFSSVVSGSEVVQSLKQSKLRLSDAEIQHRLEGTLIGKSGIVPIIISVSPLGIAKHKRTIETIREYADQVEGLGRKQLRMVGAVHESYAIDIAAEQSLSQLVLPSTVLALSISWICLGSFRAVCVVMLLAGSGQLVAISVVYYCGYQFSAVLIVLPTLIFMLTLSGAVHLVNYLLESINRDSTSRGIDALKKGWWPCTLSSLTTMLGMASLITSELAPVRQFGALSAICLGIATVILLLAFPATADLLFGLWVKPRSSSLSNEKASLEKDDGEKPNVAKPSFLVIPRSVAVMFLPWQRRQANSISISSIVLLIVVTFGLTKLQSSTKFCDMFSASHRTHQDMLWYEQNIGPISTVECLLSFETSNVSDLLQEARIIKHTVDQLNRCELIGGAFSAASFFPKLTEATGMRATTVRAAQVRGLEASLEQFQEQGLLHSTEQSRVWRISARVSAVSSIPFDQLIETVTQQVNFVVDNAELKPQVEITGLTPVMHETQRTILSDLGSSFLSAYLLITPAMMLVVRSFLGGILIMLPNVLPVALVFGVMGWQGSSLDIAGILTASVALGIAVDDTLHFVCWYVKQLGEGESRSQAVESAFHACASAMMHTTLISCCSMVPFLFADFEPTKQFARLMISLLAAALAGDLFLLPALLLSPAGKVVRRIGG